MIFAMVTQIEAIVKHLVPLINHQLFHKTYQIDSMTLVWWNVVASS